MWPMKGLKMRIEGEKNRGAMKQRKPFLWREIVRERVRERKREQCVGFIRDTMGQGSSGSQKERTPFLEFGTGYTTSPRTKGPLGITELLFNSRGQRHIHRADSMVTAFCSMQSYNCFSGTQWCKAQCCEALLQERKAGQCLLDPLSFEILNPSCSQR